MEQTRLGFIQFVWNSEFIALLSFWLATSQFLSTGGISYLFVDIPANELEIVLKNNKVPMSNFNTFRLLHKYFRVLPKPRVHP